MKIEDQMREMIKHVEFLQYRVAELEGRIYTLQQDDNLIKDVLHQRILADNLASDVSKPFQWKLAVQPTADSRIRDLSPFREKLSQSMSPEIATSPQKGEQESLASS